MIPLALGLVGTDGRDLPLKLSTGEAIERGVAGADRASSNVRIHRHRASARCCRSIAVSRRRSSSITDLNADDLAFLAAHDSDPFNRWQALQTISMRLLIDNVAALRAGQPPRSDDKLIAGARRHSRRRDAGARLRGARAGRRPAKATSRAKSAATSIPTRSFARAPALRAAIGEQLGAGTCRALRPHGRLRRLIRPTPRAPDAAPCAMSRSICWRRTAQVRGHRPRRTAIRGRRQHDRPHGGARDSVAARCARAPARSRRFLHALCRRCAGGRQMVLAPGHDPAAEYARQRARR